MLRMKLVTWPSPLGGGALLGAGLAMRRGDLGGVVTWRGIRRGISDFTPHHTAQRRGAKAQRSAEKPTTNSTDLCRRILLTKRASGSSLSLFLRAPLRLCDKSQVSGQTSRGMIRVHALAHLLR